MTSQWTCCKLKSRAILKLCDYYRISIHIHAACICINTHHNGNTYLIQYSVITLSYVHNTMHNNAWRCYTTHAHHITHATIVQGATRGSITKAIKCFTTLFCSNCISKHLSKRLSKLLQLVNFADMYTCAVNSKSREKNVVFECHI